MEIGLIVFSPDRKNFQEITAIYTGVGEIYHVSVRDFLTGIVGERNITVRDLADPKAIVKIRNENQGNKHKKLHY